MFVGNVSESSKKLIQTAYECMMKGISIGRCVDHHNSHNYHFYHLLVRPGVRYRDVGNEIQQYAHANDCSVVRSYCGHGINQ